VLWGERGVVGHHPTSPLDVWRPLAADPSLVSGGEVPGTGHFLAEENHDATLAALRTFLDPLGPAPG
jgi:pimeloyl-ACP methyl ester carboxylesterase